MATLRMSVKERRRLELFGKVKRKEMKLRKAAELLGLGYRQAKRSYARYLESGDGGLVHRLRGRPSNRRGDERRRDAILARYRERYVDFGPTLAAEYLAKDGLEVSVATLRRWLVTEKLWQPGRRGSAHRSWRPRRSMFGELVQMDGSHHDWFEGRRAWAVLMVMIDDATNRIEAQFFESESTESAMTVVRHYVNKRGLPRALYVDRDSIFRVNRAANREESLAGTPAQSQFGRAMRDLDVELICAHSPQAKGRVERCHGTLQDRLVKALRLQGIATLESANRFLEREFVPEHNARFAVRPAERGDAHRRSPGARALEWALSFQEERVVGNDWTVQWRNRWFQLTASNQRLSLAKQRIVVCEQLDGRIRLRHGDRELEWVELPERPRRRSNEDRRKAERAASGGRKPYKPANDHPWRRGL